MNRSLTDEYLQKQRNLVFVILVAGCIVLAVGGILSSLEQRSVRALVGGARKVNAATIKKQILDGKLSPRKALYYRKIPR